MLKSKVFLGSVCAGLISLSVVAAPKPDKNPVIIEIGKTQIRKNEVKAQLDKTYGDKITKDSVDKITNFLDMYSMFKVRLEEGLAKGYEKDSAIVAEYVDYKKRVANARFTEKLFIEPGIKKLYDRRKNEFRASILMIAKDSADDKKAAELNKLFQKELKSGMTFEALVKKYTHHQMLKENGGDIGFTTYGQNPPEFEEVVSNMKKGEVYSQPVKLQWGYFWVKLTDVKPRIEQVRASHILVNFNNDSNKVDTAFALKKVRAILDTLKSGKVSFEDMAKKYSKDPGSASNGGDLNFFSRGMMVPPFDMAAFSTPKGQISDVVKTDFGFHIIKVTDIKSIKSFDEDKENVKKIYQRDMYKKEYDAYKKKELTALKYKSIDEEIAKIFTKDDTLKVADYEKSQVKKNNGNTVIFNIANKKYSIDSIFKYMNDLDDLRYRPIGKNVVLEGINKFTEEQVLNNAYAKIEKEDELYQKLMSDFKNGLIVFKLQENEIWNKVKLDSTLLVKYYNENKAKMLTVDRVNFSEIFRKDSSDAADISYLINAGVAFDSLAKYTENSSYKETNGNYGMVEVSTSSLAKSAFAMNECEVSKPIKNGNGFSIIKVLRKDPVRIKTYEEAKPEVSGAVHEMETKRLEKEFTQYLKDKYKPIVHIEKINDLFK